MGVALRAVSVFNQRNRSRLAAMSAGTKRILIITSVYPPARTVGALRPLKFAKFLPEFAWCALVLTTTLGGQGSP